MHVNKYKKAESGWKRFVGRDGGMKQKKVAGSGTDKAYDRPSLMALGKKVTLDC